MRQYREQQLVHIDNEDFAYEFESVYNTQLTELTRVLGLIKDSSELQHSLMHLYNEIAINIICSSEPYSRRLVITGVGKNANLATKASETFASLGIPSMYLNSSHALHGDLGFVGPNDIVVHISNSGRTKETLDTARHIKANTVAAKGGGKQFIITGANLQTVGDLSASGVFSDIISFGDILEAHSSVKAPTSSTSVFLIVLDTLAVLLSHAMQFNRADFLKYHPGGAIGKDLVSAD